MDDAEESAATLAGVNRKYVRINRLLPTDTDVFCLLSEDEIYSVFYSEKRMRFDLVEHSNFDSAYEDLLSRLRANASYLK